ncbi:helix-turn-helix transcriptional regulator [Streptomyces sp. NPDC096198]|uniref:helix-turn-helix domain-containing protein n=1 Tax=Streptomyces sp. NPDC096198 TaxID=3366080 RepID=UPI00380FEFE2
MPGSNWRAFADLSQVYHLLGTSDRARMIARRAWQLAKACRAEPLCERLMPCSGRIVRRPHPAPPPKAQGVESLSEAEPRVTALASQGLTNREIARKLRITVSTVEQHPTRAYRKLNVRRRTDLPAETQLDFAGAAS